SVKPLEWLISAPDLTMLNLNIPNKPLEEVVGFRQADLAHIGRVQTVITSRDPNGINIELEPCDDPVSEESDSALLDKGFATVTVLEALREGIIEIPTGEWE
ncbi:MAG: hypothetical protein VYB07_02860, partial [Actinomycetota bacterium]|nr:hypothetical protein [Actinomycetota bacterium]